MDLNNFIYISTLQINPTQKTICLLGKVKGQQQLGEAIIIITPKLPKIPSLVQQKQQELPILPFSQLDKIFENDIYSKFQVRFQNSFQIQSVFPITQKHKNKYLKKTKIIQKQTGQAYKLKSQSLLQTQLKHIGWVRNIIDGKAEQERVLYKDQNIMLLPDFKFHNLKQLQNLHLLCIFNDPNIHSIRDLNGSHLPLLERVQAILGQQISRIFENRISSNNCRIYFHYPPTFYQLHLHIQSLQLDTKTCNTERCHQLTTVIENIKIKQDYYQHITLNCFKEISNN